MTSRSQIKRHPERAVPDETSDILLEGAVAHVGFADEVGPVVIPLLYGFSQSEPGRIILHGSRASRLQKVLASGAPACVTVTLLDGLVYSRSAKFHSANYRSVTCFGRAEEITDPAAKKSAMAAMTARYFQGRTSGRDYEPPTERELDEITVVEFTIEESSAKARRGGPKGPRDDDPAAPGSAGVVELPGA
jgi:nitroimidazol reductase NimA-like FMN-containing flavoprotein (pyridoxamine 5'-phosphate oxidase superfamily)